MATASEENRREYEPAKSESARRDLRRLDIMRVALRRLRERFERAKSSKEPISTLEWEVLHADLVDALAPIAHFASQPVMLAATKIIEREQPDASDLEGAIAALERILDGRRLSRLENAPWYWRLYCTLLLPDPVRVHSSKPRNGAPMPVVASGAAKEDTPTDYTPSEATLLVGLTEKFYGSWPIRIAGIGATGALAGAIMFAVAGTIVIGNQTTNVSRKIDEMAETAMKDFDRRRADARAAFEAQAADFDRRSKDATATLARSETVFRETQAEYAKFVFERKDEIERTTAAFRSNDKELRSQAVTAAVELLRQQLNDKASALSSALTKQIEKLEDQVKGLAARATSAETQLSQLLGKLGAAEANVTAIDGRLTSIRNNATKLAGDQLDTKEALRTATDMARSAKHQSELAQAAWRSVTDETATLARKFAGPEGDLGAFRARLITLDGNLDAAEKALAPLGRKMQDLQKAAETLEKASEKLATLPATITRIGVDAAEAQRRLADIAERLDQAIPRLDTLEPRLVDLELRAKAAAAKFPDASVIPPVPNSEQELGSQGWLKIQQALAQRGFGPVAVDGIVGPRTRQAIVAFQRQTGAKSDGRLTGEQIATLWPAAR